MFQKILVPIDGSEHSNRALECAVEIAKNFRSQLTLVHVYSVTATPIIMPEPTTMTPSGIPPVNPAEVSKMVAAERDAGHQILKEARQKVAAEGVEAETVLKEGNSVQEITKLAKDRQFDLIVIGMRGVSKLRELLIGSVSEGVLKKAPCPVLIVK